MYSNREDTILKTIELKEFNTILVVVKITFEEIDQISYISEYYESIYIMKKEEYENLKDIHPFAIDDHSEYQSISL